MIDKFDGTNIEFNLISGNIIQRKKDVAVYISIVCFCLALVAFLFTLIGAILKFNLGVASIALVGTSCVGYILLINAYTQPSKNYYIKIKNENSFEGFELYYKEKLIDLKYEIDKNGKFKWPNSKAKLECISYLDGTNMSNFTKYKIINYFSTWLQENDYLSKDVVIKIEKL